MRRYICENALNANAYKARGKFFRMYIISSFIDQFLFDIQSRFEFNNKLFPIYLPAL